MADIDKPRQNSGFRVIATAVIWAGVAVFGFYSSTHMVAAGDTWVALACGRHHANHGVNPVEPFSFNSHKAGPTDEQLKDWPQWTHGIIKKINPTGWINQNWLTHVTFYELVHLFGTEGNPNYNMLVVWKFALFMATAFVVYALGRVMGVCPLLAAIASCLAMVVGRTFFDIRPACLSNFFVPLYLLILALAVYKNIRWIWLLVPTVAIWANFHGGYIYVYMMMVPFVGLHILLNLPRRWTFSLGMSAIWLLLYFLYYKTFNNSEFLRKIVYLLPAYEKLSFFNDRLYLLLFFLTGSLVLSLVPRMNAAIFYLYHIVASVVILGTIIDGSSLPISTLSDLGKEMSEFIANFSYMSILLFLVSMVMVLLLTFQKKRFAGISNRHIYHIIFAGVLSFCAMIIFNPYHLTNLTHTFEISISKHAESWRSVNEWRPAFDFMDKERNTPNPVGEEEAFGVMCILFIIVLVIWIIAQNLRPRMEFGRKSRPEDIEIVYQDWPKINLPLLAVTVFTTYMAIQSRRFIAIAGPAACPMVFLLIQQIWQVSVFDPTRNLPLDGRVIAPFNLRKFLIFILVAAIGGLAGGVLGFVFKGRHGIGLGIIPGALALWGMHRLILRLFPNPQSQKTVLISLFGLVCLVCGSLWGGEFKKVYLDPWPEDPLYNSVFMRMTASNVKPMDISKFINDNHITGRMFNYWTEGGALAFGQKPDPVTGDIPLKLFMDGRAQAAYNHDTFVLWQEIYYGGPLMQRVRQSGKKMTAGDSREIAGWIDQELARYNVWVVLLPASEIRKEFGRTLLFTDNWKIAYNDPYQTMMVNVKTPQGRELVDNILADKAVFPNAVSRNLTLCKLIPQQYSPALAGKLEQAAVGAFAERPCSVTMVELFNAGSLLNKSSVILSQIQKYLAEFETNQGAYRHQNGYMEKLRCAIMAADFISRNFADQREKMIQKKEQFEVEENSLSQNAVW